MQDIGNHSMCLALLTIRSRSLHPHYPPSLGHIGQDGVFTLADGDSSRYPWALRVVDDVC